MKLNFIILFFASLCLAQNGTITMPNLDNKKGQIDSDKLWEYNLAEKIYRGQLLHDQGLFKEAIESYQEAIQILPEPTPKDELASIYYEIGMSYDEMTQTDSALFYGKKSIQTKPTDQSYSLVGDIYDKMDNIDSALVYYNSGLKFFPTSYWLLYNKSIALSRVNRDKEAYTTIMESIKHTREHEGSYFIASSLSLEQQKWIDFFVNGAYSRIIGQTEDRNKFFIKYLSKIITEKANSSDSVYFTPYVHENWINIVHHDFKAEITEGDSIKTKYQGNYELLTTFMVIALKKAVSQGYDFQLKPLYKTIVSLDLAESYIHLVLQQTFPIDFDIWKQSHGKEIKRLYEILGQYIKE